MQDIRVEFHFDFGSPNAYLSHRLIPTIEANTGASFDYVPVLIGGVFKLTNNVSPMEANKGIKNKSAYGQMETRRFLARHGISNFRMNPHFPVNTLQVMRGAVYAQRNGIGPAYINAVFSALWEQELDISDETVLLSVLDKAGLDGKKILAHCRDDEVKQGLMDNTAASVARGSFGSPFFFLGEEIFFGKDKLDDLEREIQRRKGKAIGAIEWRDLTVDNPEQLRDFYAAVVGWDSSAVSMGSYSDFNMNLPGTRQAVAGICHALESNANLPAQWLMYARVANVDDSIARCEKLGGTVIDGPRALAGERFCVIQDPAGAVLALYGS